MSKICEKDEQRLIKSTHYFCSTNATSFDGLRYTWTYREPIRNALYWKIKTVQITNYVGIQNEPGFILMTDLVSAQSPSFANGVVNNIGTYIPNDGLQTNVIYRSYYSFKQYNCFPDDILSITFWLNKHDGTPLVLTTSSFMVELEILNKT